MKLRLLIASLAIVALIVVGEEYLSRENFPLPSGTAEPFTQVEESVGDTTEQEKEQKNITEPFHKISMREIFVTDDTKHSIPLNEILSGGPGKDGIPSIDEPKFVDVREAGEFLDDSDPGIGLVVEGESRFYPYRILVWHEIVNDTVDGVPVLVTYCPLCATGIVFQREIDGKAEEFGVSGRLWQSNLLMYNRASSEDGESLWSQVLGEAVVGVHTGKKLSIVPSDIVRWADWKKLHPGASVLSEDTGTVRSYGRDPYGDYYTSESVSFGAKFRDTRLHPKALVAGIEIDGLYKAYHIDALPNGEIEEMFAGKTVRVTKDEAERLGITADGVLIPHVPGFWFSWLAVHPDTELYK